MSQAQELAQSAPHWQLKIMDMKRVVKAEARMRFTNEPAHSCMAGKWRRAVVEASNENEPTFFPLSEPLAYMIKDGKVSLGRTQICDNYLFLSGKLDGGSISGTYDAVSIGYSKQLGYFELKNVR
jgi:hypothetical protein